MPRYKIAKNMKQFGCLISILDFPYDVGTKALEVIKMLATNPILYENVLKLDKEWPDIFDESNVH